MHDNEFSELKGSEKRFKALFKSSPPPIFVWRREGDDFVRFDHNDAAQDLAGGIADRATGMTASELLTDWPDVIRCMRQCFAQRKTVTDVRKRSIPRAALPRWFETTFVFVPPDLVMVHAHDLSDSVESENEHRAGERSRCGPMVKLADGIMTINENRLIVSVNRAVETMFGYRRGELTDRNVSTLMTEHDRDRNGGCITAYQMTGRGRIPGLGPREVTAFHKNGNTFPAELNASEAGLGDRPIFFGRRYDSTARKQAEKAMRESEQQLRAIADNSPSIIYLRDTASKILKINKTYERFYGVTQEEAIGRQGHEWLGEELAQRLIGRDQEVLSTGMPIETEFEAVDSTGKPHYMRSVKFPIRNEEGAVIAIGGISTNITEQKQAQNELQQQKTFFETLVENTPAIVTMKDTDGKYLFVNKNGCDVSNKTPDEIIGKTATEAFGADPDGPLSEFSRTAIATGEPILGIERNSEFSDEMLVLSNFVPIKGADGKVDRLLTISFDITEQRQRDEQLRQAQKMEAVGQLTGGVAHDFNNLLAIVIGNLELLSDRVSDDEVALGFVERAISGAQRGADLTHRLLAFSRKQALIPAVIDPRKLVDGLLDLMRRTLGETIEIEVSSGDDPWRCEADPGQLENAILNLAINARDAMPGGGTLTIKTANVVLGDASAARAKVAPGQYVMVAVTDTGVGIPAEAIDHVFEPFFTTKETGKGTGLGLSMVYGFAKQSGGDVTIHSEQGVGTAVSLYLPRSVKGAEERSGEDHEAVPGARGETILVVEDDPGVRTLVVALLRDLGYRVLEARDGQSALAALDPVSRVDLLLTDVVLPQGMSGPSLAREVRRRRPGLSVLFMSGYTDDAINDDARSVDGVALLDKPFRKTDLASKVRSVLDKETSQPLAAIS